MQITSDIELSGAGCTTAITPNQLVQSSSENDIHAQPVRELDHRPHDSLVTGIIREPGDKGLVDFQCGDGAAFQMLQAGIAGAEVVGGEAHADGAQGVETGEQGWIAECDRFGQFDLQKLGGQGQTVKTAQPVSESRPLPSPTISQNFSRLIITGKPGSTPVTLSPTARNRTVSQWIKTLLPEGWKFRQENAATPKLNTKLVSWSANDQWTRSLNRLLEEQHLWGHLDWDNKTLTVTTSAAAPAQDTATTISPAAMVTTSTSPESSTTANSQNKPRNPFRGNSVSPSTPAAIPTPTGSTVKSIPLMTGTPVKPVSQGKEWRAPAGTTLRENIIKWAEETKCESMASTHWMVIWPLSVTDYRLDAPLMFRGSFESAMEQVFELYRTAQKPLYAQASRMQCIITVSDTRDGR